MRRLGIALSAFLCSSAAASAEAPFARLPNAVDYVATMATKRYGREAGEKVVTHYGGWTRVDRLEDGYRKTGYVNRAAIDAAITRGTSGAYIDLSIRRGPEQDRYPPLDDRSFRTGERRVFLGESCELWNVLRARDGGFAE